MIDNLLNRIFSDTKGEHFNENALEVFHFQAGNNYIYRKYLDNIDIDINKIYSIREIPFMPIEFFKKHKVVSYKSDKYDIIFSSSGTTGKETSKHYVKDLTVYIKSFTEAFRTFYGNVEEYNIIALLPSYVERQGSSLVYMVEHLIKDSKNCESGFFLNSYYNELSDKLIDLRSRNKKTLLIGVTYALLDFAEFLKKSGRDKSLEDIIIMETGGMKGRRKEMIKEEMHSILKESFGVNSIHSEYGMTELLSQAYSYGESIYECPPWMSVLIRDINDPFTILEYGRSGIINIIDLANIYSCSFIATDDLGVLDSNGKFQIRGRLDNSQIRGCNLLI